MDIKKLPSSRHVYDFRRGEAELRISNNFLKMISNQHGPGPSWAPPTLGLTPGIIPGKRERSPGPSRACLVSKNLNHYFHLHVCPSIRTYYFVLRLSQKIFSLKSPWNHSLTPGSTPGVDPGYPRGTQPLRRS